MKLIILALVFLSGCSMIPKRHIAVSPTVTVSELGRVEVKGDAQTPPKVDTKKTDGRMVIPEGSKFEFNEKLGVMTLVMAKASEMALNRTETAIQGPVAFKPDAPPTPSQVAEGQMTIWYRLGLTVGIAAALFGLVRGWNYVMYGGAAVSAACLFGLFVQNNPILLLVIGLGIAAAIFGPIIWHTKLKKLEPPSPPPQA